MGCKLSLPVHRRRRRSPLRHRENGDMWSDRRGRAGRGVWQTCNRGAQGSARRRLPISQRSRSETSSERKLGHRVGSASSARPISRLHLRKPSRRICGFLLWQTANLRRPLTRSSRFCIERRHNECSLRHDRASGCDSHIPSSVTMRRVPFIPGVITCAKMLVGILWLSSSRYTITCVVLGTYNAELREKSGTRR